LSVFKEAYYQLKQELDQHGTTLVAVSKTKPVEDIMELYRLGQRDFGENYVQELVLKSKQLPTDIRWHFIGHLQTNKVKLLAPFIHLIQSADSYKLFLEINKQGEKCQRVIDCLLQVHIAKEETKFGLDEKELADVLKRFTADRLKHVRINGLMGMASLTANPEEVRKEFQYLHRLYREIQTLNERRETSNPDEVIKAGRDASISNFQFQTLSMGMSSDYRIAVEEGSNMVRIGSLIFGNRN
jgi:PLP dependent protein